MRRFLVISFVFISFLCKSQNPEQVAPFFYGAGVRHQSLQPSHIPLLSVNPTLLTNDSTEQAFYTYNKTFGHYKLMSPTMRYVRDFYNIYFAENQIIQYSFIHSQLQIRSLSINPLHGYYIVKMTIQGGDITKTCELDMASIPNLILAPPSYLVSNNDYFVIRYERGILKECRQIIDKTRFKIQQIEDSIRVHRIEIDNLKTGSSSNEFWSLSGNSIDNTKFIGTKNNQDFVIKTNDLQRIVVQKDGFVGFGVTSATSYADAKNIRNRGQYYDYFNNTGQRGQRLASLIQGTMWVDDYKFLTLQHTNADEFISIGKSKTFISVPNYLDKLSNILVTTINNNFQETTIIRVFTYNPTGQEITIGTLTIQAGGVRASLNLDKTVDFDVLRLEVTQAAAGVKGLSCTFTFLDTQ